ncbi:hypothetical protein MNB_SV-6-1638 [hydrothermal vent metagenome]|uniref:Uncharacterized protein n=1 Tax=hydrothermal vent metagenome TaxID=652676 RepID=A0A1W1BR63_9ZZZZ
MQPHEIKPDTKLCTILGYNAQTGHTRRYFNKIMKHYGINATAIALNITDEHFDFTMQSVGSSKVDKMMIESEFAQSAIKYCDKLNSDAEDSGRVDFIEVDNGKVYGYCLDSEAERLFEDLSLIDDQTLFVAKMILTAHRWYGTPIEIDIIPILIQ